MSSLILVSLQLSKDINFIFHLSGGEMYQAAGLCAVFSAKHSLTLTHLHAIHFVGSLQGSHQSRCLILLPPVFPWHLKYLNSHLLNCERASACSILHTCSR